MGDITSLLASSQFVKGISGVAGSVEQAGAVGIQGQYQANQYQFNSQIAGIQAEQAIAVGERNVQLTEMREKQIKGAQRAGFAGQGVVVGPGSTADVLQDTAHQASQDIMTLRNNAWRQAWGFKVESETEASKAGFAKLAAANTVRNTILSGAASGLSDFEKGAYWGYKADWFSQGKHSVPILDRSSGQEEESPLSGY